MVVVMHDFNMVERFCDRAILLSDGKVVSMGNTRDVMTREQISSVYETDFDIIEKDGRRFFFPKDAK